VTCTEFLAQLDELLDEKIPGAMRADLEQHLRECEHCVITYSTTRKTIEIYQRHELYELPTALRDRLHAAIMAKCKKC
jgi:anti-sigma factor RsiW